MSPERKDEKSLVLGNIFTKQFIAWLQDIFPEGVKIDSSSDSNDIYLTPKTSPLSKKVVHIASSGRERPCGGKQRKVEVTFSQEGRRFDISWTENRDPQGNVDEVRCLKISPLGNEEILNENGDTKAKGPYSNATHLIVEPDGIIHPAIENRPGTKAVVAKIKESLESEVEDGLTAITCTGGFWTNGPWKISFPMKFPLKTQEA